MQVYEMVVPSNEISHKDKYVIQVVHNEQRHIISRTNINLYYIQRKSFKTDLYEKMNLIKRRIV